MSNPMSTVGYHSQQTSNPSLHPSSMQHQQLEHYIVNITCPLCAEVFSVSFSKEVINSQMLAFSPFKIGNSMLMLSRGAKKKNTGVEPFFRIGAQTNQSLGDSLK